LAHLSTKCSWWAIVVSGCPSSSVVRRPSTFDVYTVEATFATLLWWNLVRMFVSTISRPSLNMGHVWSKTRSPGQILRNSCLHSRGRICDPILMKLDQNVVLKISRTSSNICHAWLKTRSPGQLLGNFCLLSRGQIGNMTLMKLDQNVCLSNI